MEEIKIALVIRGARAMLGLSLKEMGLYIGVPPTTLGKWENNKLSPKAVAFLKIHKFILSHGIDYEFSDDGRVLFSIDPKSIKELEKENKIVAE